MMVSKREFTLAALGALIGGAIAVTTAFVVPPKYEAKASVIVLRKRVEIPELTQEEDKNRWAWVRDGYALAQVLLSDDFLLPYLKSHAAFHSQLDPKLDENLAVHVLASRVRKQVNIQFTGGDEFAYLIAVRDSDRQAALELTQALVGRVQELAAADITRRYERVSAQLEERFHKEGTKDGAIPAKLQELKVNAWLNAAEQADRVKVISEPYLPQTPVWPAKKLWALIGMILGASVGFLGTRMGQCGRPTHS